MPRFNEKVVAFPLLAAQLAAGEEMRGRVDGEGRAADAFCVGALRQDVGDGAAVTHAQEVFVRGGGDAEASVRQISVQHGVCERHGERGEADAIGGARGGGAQVGSERGVERVRQGELNTVCRDGGGREMPQEVRIVNGQAFLVVRRRSRDIRKKKIMRSLKASL